MDDYTVYYIVGEKKFKQTVRARSVSEAKDKVIQSINFVKIKKHEPEIMNDDDSNNDIEMDLPPVFKDIFNL